MRVETHQEALETHRRAIFTWGLEIEGLEKAQRIVGLHASRGIIELLSIFLHTRKLVDEGFQLNHRWFKSEKVARRLPEFPEKEVIVKKLILLENLCEHLAYGTPKPAVKTEEAIKLFQELEELIKKHLQT